MLFGCKPAAQQNSSIKQANSSMDSHPNFFDDDGYPLERGSFTVVKYPYCHIFAELPKGKSLKDVIQRGLVTTSFYDFTNMKNVLVQYKYDNTRCTGSATVRDEYTYPLKKIRWEKVEIDGKKALYSKSNSIIDYGIKMCFLVDGEPIDSEPSYCSSIVYNRNQPIKKVQESVVKEPPVLESINLPIPTLQP